MSSQPTDADRALARRLVFASGKGLAREAGEDCGGVPPEMCDGEPDESGWVQWRSTELDVSEAEWSARTSRLPVPLPPLFRALLTTVSGLDNHYLLDGESVLLPSVPSDEPLGDGLGKVLSHDSLWSAGYYYFGNYKGDGYLMLLLDFERRLPDGDMPVVWADHEDLSNLTWNKERVERSAIQAVCTELRPSLREVVQGIVDQLPDPDAPDPYPGVLWERFLLGRTRPTRAELDALVVDLIASHVAAPPCALLSHKERWEKSRSAFNVASAMGGTCLRMFDEDKDREWLEGSMSVLYEGGSSAELRAALASAPYPSEGNTLTLWFGALSERNPKLRDQVGAWIAPQIVIEIPDSPSSDFDLFDGTKSYMECRSSVKGDVFWYLAVVGRSEHDQDMPAEIERIVRKHARQPPVSCFSRWS